MELPFVSRKKLEETISQLADLKKEIGTLKEKTEKRLIKESYLFTGDVIPDAQGKYSQEKSDLTFYTYWELQKQCYDSFKTFPLAKRVIEMMTDFVIGAELTYSIAEKYREKLEPVLESFWSDYDNDFDSYLEGMVNELWLLGEQIYPVSVDDTTSVVKLGIVDPREVEKILRDDKNQKRLKQVVLQNDAFGKTRVYGVIHEVNGKLIVPDEYKKVEVGQEYKGDVFLFQINRLPTQTRGYSELSTMLEALDLLDQFVFKATERSLLLFHFLADIEIKGKSEAEIAAFNVPDPRKNTVFKHSQNVKMDLFTPDIKALDAGMIVQMVVRYILAGVGIPEHWVVVGDSTTMATAKEQNNPIEKRLERKQGTIKYALKKMIRYQFEQKFPSATREEIQEYINSVFIEFPTVAGVDRKFRAQVMNETAKSLVIAASQGWITGKSAAQEFVNLANKFGMELEAVEIIPEVTDITHPAVKKGSDLDTYFKTMDGLAKDIEFGKGKKIGNKLDMKTA